MLNKYMEILIKETSNCTLDIPVGAMIVKDNEIVALKTNEREQRQKITAHAEILALDCACEKLNSKYLLNCDMYVTLEPCPMCAWAIINSKIKNLYFGAYDTKYGALGSALNLQLLINSKINIKGGILEDKCNELLKNYFKELRDEKNFR